MLNFILEGLSDALSVTRILIVFPLLYLLHNCLLIRLFGNHWICFFKSFNEDINSAIKLSQVVLHVLLLSGFTFRFFVRVEFIKSFFLALGVHCMNLTRVLVFLSLLLSSLRISVLLLHESLSSLKGSSFDIFSSLWEQFAEFLDHGFFNTHENNVRKNVILQTWSGIVWDSLKSLENNVRLKVV